MDKMLSNIHGTDAALLAMCWLMYKVILGSKKGEQEEVIMGVKAMTGVALSIIIARVLITLVPLFVK